MKKGIFLVLSLTMLGFSLRLMASEELLAINFTQQDEVSQLELVLSGNKVEAKKFNVTEDKQIIIDLKNVRAAERVMRAFDTSEFSGSIVFVSAYEKPGSSDDVRVALQLRENVRSTLERMPNRLILKVENRFGAFSQEKLRKNLALEVSISGSDEMLVQEQEQGQIRGKLNVPRSKSVEDILENLTQSGRKRYVGQKISFNLRDVAVNDILKMIAETSGFNIITTNDVQELPALTLNLTNIPWDQALDTILSLNKLVAEKNGMILTIKTLTQATSEAEDAAKARELAVIEEPLVTTVFPISYASNSELSEIISKYLTPDRGKISIDQRTNSLIVNDTSGRIEKIRRIVETLDTQTPQVLIESKIVEVTETFRQEIGLQNGLNFGYDPIGANGSVVPADVGSIDRVGTQDAGPGFSFSSTSSGDAGMFGLSVSKFGRLLNLNFDLQLLESESKAKIVASPKVITENKKRATLTTRQTTSYQRSSGVGEDRTVEFEEISAELSLQVTPQVTNEGSISLEIELAKEQFGTSPSPGAPPDKQGRGIQTNVLVDNGSTIVLGGIYNFKETQSVSGVPFLKDVPLIGWLFRTPYSPSTRKNELVIFITPRVINQEEAGLVDRG